MPTGEPQLNMPHGSVTFLMTDVEGSTRHWEEHPEAMREALIRYARIATEIVGRNSGFLIKNRGAGDSLFIVFSDPTDAMRAAVEFQKRIVSEIWQENISFKVRMALHCGDVELIEGTYYGVTVNYANRLSSLGHGGQVLASEAFIRVLNSAEATPSAKLRYLGVYTLQSGQEVGKVYQIASPELRDFFPRLRFVTPCSHNLPQYATHFFGHEEQVVRIRTSIPDTPLLTLLAPGGMGKTRIALEVGREVLGYEGEGVWYIDFDQAISGEETLSRVLGIQAGCEHLYTYLREKRVLIICDSCKNTPERALSFAAGLLEHCPQVRLLMCCIAPLGHPQEAIFSIPPLNLPSKELVNDPAQLMTNEAVILFADRVISTLPSFRVEPENARAVVEICHHLKGIPYALELVAARYRDSLPEALLGELETTLCRDAEESILQDTIDWSYKKLEEPQQILLQRLSVMPGAWTLEAAERICSDERIELWEVLDFLNDLLNRSLVLYEEEEGTPRYRMHHTVRKFAGEKLREASEEISFLKRYESYRQGLGVAL